MMILHEGYGSIQCLWIQEVIAVKEADESAGSVTYAAIARSGKPHILLMDHSNARIFSLILFQNYRPTIGRTVVHANNLYVRKCLIDYAIQTFTQIRLYIIYRKDNGNLRRSLVFITIHYTITSQDGTVFPADQPFRNKADMPHCNKQNCRKNHGLVHVSPVLSTLILTARTDFVSD